MISFLEMDIRQISSLIAIVDYGSFSAAARALFTVQSNISSHIAHLETELGVTLIDRQTSKITPEGSIVVAHGRRILREIGDISSNIAALDDVVSGDMHLGVIGTTGRWLMPQFLTKLRSTYPEVRPLISEGGTSSLVPRLIGGQLDAAIVHLPIDQAELLVEPLFAEDLILLVHTKHPWSINTTLDITSLGEYPLVLPPRSSALRRIINRSANVHGVTLKVQAEIDGVRLMASLAFEGFGATIVPATAVPSWLTGDFVRISVPDLPQRVVGWAQRKRPRPRPQVDAARVIARESVNKRAGRQQGLHVGLEAFPLKGLKGVL